MWRLRDERVDEDAHLDRDRHAGFDDDTHAFSSICRRCRGRRLPGAER